MGIYWIVIVIAFSVIKLVNYRLHIMYDTGSMVVEEEPSENQERSKTSDTIPDIDIPANRYQSMFKCLIVDVFVTFKEKLFLPYLLMSVLCKTGKWKW